MQATRIIATTVAVGMMAGAAVFSAGAEDAVAVQYHFAGAAELAQDTNFETAVTIFKQPSSAGYEALVLDRLSRVFWSDLQFDAGGKPTEVLRPLLEELLQVESVGSFGASQENLSFVIAARLKLPRAEAWQHNLQTATKDNGEAFSAEGFSGTRWSNGVWIITAPEWVVVGRGDGLASVRRDYLQQLQKTGRPWPELKDKWFQGVIDWPLLAAGNPAPSIPLKPARTTVDMTATGGRFHITAYLSYPDAVAWTPQPWRIPKNLPRQPLNSFTAAQGIEPYLQLNEVFSKLPTDPFTNQIFCWSQREMPFQDYMAWPVTGASNLLKELSTQGVALVNPILAKRGHSQLVWSAPDSELTWNGSPLLRPFVRVAPGTDGEYLEAGLFFEDDRNEAAPADLWAQFENRSDVVSYSWELTGNRMHQWRSLSQVLPLLAPAAGRGLLPPTDKKMPPPLVAVEDWLQGIEPLLGNTVTEISRTGPDELTVLRSAPFVFSGLELVWLSHWLADIPAGPVNLGLMPKAAISGPGIPKN